MANLVAKKSYEEVSDELGICAEIFCKTPLYSTENSINFLMAKKGSETFS